ncbi:hypothetical protein PanWU01x14_328340 [Parasponia andersonii]|uniref:Uncharacterized protein n=1 Tax=Parasponia andersonii TaxID=3476 RepID=A0A2P5AIY5_PARAD|nr:hypothetical protein PanWU01x14_328340 [Parasponia andersonii]
MVVQFININFCLVDEKNGLLIKRNQALTENQNFGLGDERLANSESMGGGKVFVFSSPEN